MKINDRVIVYGRKAKVIDLKWDTALVQFANGETDWVEIKECKKY